MLPDPSDTALSLSRRRSSPIAVSARCECLNAGPAVCHPGAPGSGADVTPAMQGRFEEVALRAESRNALERVEMLTGCPECNLRRVPRSATSWRRQPGHRL